MVHSPGVTTIISAIVLVRKGVELCQIDLLVVKTIALNFYYKSCVASDMVSGYRLGLNT